MRLSAAVFLSLSTILCSSCREDATGISNPEVVELIFDFQNNAQSWEGDFADYPLGEEEFYALSYEFSYLPSPLDTRKGALKQSGNNHSDDLFMFIQRQIKDLDPNTDYKVSFEIEFATDVADDMVGVGGSPGEDVAIKAGATNIKPEKIVDDKNSLGYEGYIMNIDKGNQLTGGSDMIVIGDFSNDTDQNTYTLKTVIADDIPLVITNSLGELWLAIGTDSGFEATTTIYYNNIKVKLEKN